MMKHNEHYNNYSSHCVNQMVLHGALEPENNKNVENLFQHLQITINRKPRVDIRFMAAKNCSILKLLI